jgi:hypothetical protein
MENFGNIPNSLFYGRRTYSTDDSYLTHSHASRKYQTIRSLLATSTKPFLPLTIDIVVAIAACLFTVRC